MRNKTVNITGNINHFIYNKVIVGKICHNDLKLLVFLKWERNDFLVNVLFQI